MKNALASSLFAAASLLAVSSPALADVGANWTCWSNDASTGKCSESSVDFNQNGFYGREKVSVTRLPENGSSDKPFRVTFELELNDYWNVFSAVGSVGAIINTNAYGFHRQRSYFATSTPVTLVRDYGTRVLRATWSVDLKNNYGAEYVEFATGTEILLPGQSPIGFGL